MFMLKIPNDYRGFVQLDKQILLFTVCNVNLQLVSSGKNKISKNSHLLSILVISSSYCIVELQYQRGNSDRKMSSKLNVSLLSCLDWFVDLISCILNISLIFWRGVRRLSFCLRLLFHSEISSNLHIVNIGPTSTERFLSDKVAMSCKT